MTTSYNYFLDPNLVEVVCLTIQKALNVLIFLTKIILFLNGNIMPFKSKNTNFCSFVIFQPVETTSILLRFYGKSCPKISPCYKQVTKTYLNKHTLLTQVNSNLLIM